MGGHRVQGEPGGRQGAPGGVRRSQAEPGGARGGQEDPGGDRRSQEESSGTEENPVFQKGEKAILAHSCFSWLPGGQGWF